MRVQSGDRSIAPRQIEWPAMQISNTNVRDRILALVKAILEANSIAADIRPQSRLVDAGLTSMDMVSLMLGVDGSMIIAPAVFPAAYQETVRLLHEGKTTESLRVFSERVLPFIHLFGLGDEVQNTKALYKHLGIFRSDEVRLPLIPCSRERLREVVLAYDLCQSAAVQQHV